MKILETPQKEYFMKEYKFESAVLTRGINAILPHVAKPGSHTPIIEHVHIFSDGNSLILEATDRFRIGRVKVPLLGEDDPQPLDVLVRAESLKALALSIKGSKALSGRLIAEGDLISARLLDLTVWSDHTDWEDMRQWPNVTNLLSKTMAKALVEEHAAPGVQVNPELLTGITAGLKAAAGAKAWRESGVGIHRAGGDENSSLVLTFQDWFVAVLMPMAGRYGHGVSEKLEAVAELAQIEAPCVEALV